MSRAPERPNILFMIADDHRYSAIRACGDPTVQTLVLDRLIQDGVSFDRNYHYGGLTGAVCVPARACLMAGNNPFRALASRDLHDRAGLMTINPELPTLPEVFRKAGYHTYMWASGITTSKALPGASVAGARSFWVG